MRLSGMQLASHMGGLATGDMAGYMAGLIPDKTARCLYM